MSSSEYRMDVGGKLLTNQLKEVVSYRQWNMMDETYIMNHAKEACCYVSTQFIADLETCRYVVPFTTQQAVIQSTKVEPEAEFHCNGIPLTQLFHQSRGRDQTPRI
jgi:hypothetical protein